MIEGATIGGYVLEAKLGAGGMGAVFKARHPQFPGRSFALKVLLDPMPSESSAERFGREMRALAAVAHPNVVRIYGGAVDGGKPFYVMELVDGEALSSLARGKPLPAKRAVAIVRALADAVAFAHSKGVIHRDLKPANVVVEPGDKPRILDFGLARIASEQRLTRSGSVMGTPAYSAPEQLDGRAHAADGRADVYALGAILWFALTGRAPFEGDSATNLLKKVLVEDVGRPSAFARGVPMELDAVCMHAMAKEPGSRYGSAFALREDLDRFLRGEAVTAPVLSSLDEIVRVTKRREVKLGIRGAIALAAVIAAGAVSLYLAHGYAQRRKKIDDAYAAAMLAGTKCVDIRAAIGILKEASDPRAAALESRYNERALADAIAAFKADPTPELGSLLAQAALAAPESASLVGEPVAGEVPEAAGFAVGDALLALRDRLIEARGAGVLARGGAIAGLVSRAEALALARLERTPADAAARALRAHARLALAGAPRAPFAEGRADAPLPAEALADLEAASRLPGALGAREAWLRVDLLAARPGPEAREALEKARERDPDGLAPSFERILGTSFDVAGYGSLLRRLEDPKTRARAAFELDRFFARNGCASAFEHPELAARDRTPAELLAACERAVAHDDVAPFMIVRYVHFDRPQLERFFAIHDGIEGGMAAEKEEAERFREDAPLVLKRRYERFLSRRDKAEKLLLESLGSKDDAWRGVDSFPLLAHHLWKRLTAPVYQILCVQAKITETDSVAEGFNSKARAYTRLGFGSLVYWEDVWETGDGFAGCEKFDAQLDRDLQEDPFLRLLLDRGFDREAIARATSATKGLRRIEELMKGDAKGTERDRFAFEAHLGMDALAKLGGPPVLPFRARLRKLAYPAPVAAALSAIDLLRGEWIVRRDFPDEFAYARDDDFQWSRFAVLLAGNAADEPNRLDPLADRLFEIACSLSRMRVRLLGAQLLRDGKADEDWQHYFQTEIKEHFADVGSSDWVKPLAGRYDAALRRQELALTAQDIQAIRELAKLMPNVPWILPTAVKAKKP